jgi:hypothetical protein
MSASLTIGIVILVLLITPYSTQTQMKYVHVAVMLFLDLPVLMFDHEYKVYPSATDILELVPGLTDYGFHF